MTAGPGAGAPVARAAGRAPRRRAWSLQRRLVVTVVALLAGVCLALATVSTLALRASLVERIDGSLGAASMRAGRAPDGSAPVFPVPGDVPSLPDVTDPSTTAPGTTAPPVADGRPPFLAVPGQSTGTLGLRLQEGEVREQGYLDDDGTVQDLTADQLAILASVEPDGTPRTVDLPGLGSYRVVAVERGGATATTPSSVQVTGLSLDGTTATLTRYLTVEIGIGVAAGVLAAIAASVLVRRALRPLAHVTHTATRIAHLALHEGAVNLPERVDDDDTRTEVGRVGAALNRMIDHVEKALSARFTSETQVRQFVADASHELRTPLASIRGYAELVRRSDDQVPTATSQALARIESESVRMSGLVEDLLLLARLDAGRPLEREAVDLLPLAVECLADAHAAGPDHVWRLDLPAEDEDTTSFEVTGDDARLRQVLVNLLSNARVHTPPGTSVTLRLRAAADGGVDVDVSDDGPGIAPDLLPLLFDRFTRGDSARGREAGSTGLGLAIAHAIVAAHGGELSVTTTPGATTFRVHLPRLA